MKTCYQIEKFIIERINGNEKALKLCMSDYEISLKLEIQQDIYYHVLEFINS